MAHRTRLLVLLVATALWASAAMTPALAHSFLATTRPSQDARLAEPPTDVALQLSEPVVADAVRLTVVDEVGQPLEAGRIEIDEDGRVVRLPLVDPEPGIYRVSWHVISAVDGHESAGEFAFAAGDTTASVATGTVSSRRAVPWTASAGTWLLLGGWSIALGAALLSLRPATTTAGVAFPGRPRTWVRAGALAALAGLGVRIAATETSGMAVTTVMAGTALALLGALQLARWSRRWPPLVALAAVALVWPGRGHPATQGAVGWMLDTLHLAAAGVWLGGLAVVVAGLVIARRSGELSAAQPLVWRYARFAAFAVGVLVVTGVANGLLLVPSLDALVASGYGQLLLLKAGLLVIALVAAAISRWRLLPRRRMAGLRRLVRPELVTVTLALAAAAVLVDVAPPRPAVAETFLGPPPIEGPIARAAGMAGQLTVDVQAGAGRIDVNVRGSSGGIDSDLELTARLPDGAPVELHPRPCGDGCLTVPLDLPEGETTLTVAAAADGWQGGSTQLALTWPPEPARPERFDRMLRAMRDADTVLVSEAAGADPQPPTGDSTSLSGEQLVTLMPWAGGGVTDVRPVAGEPDRFTFYLPGSHMWFDVTVDDQDRLLAQRLVNPGHDIRYRFAYPSDP